MNDRVKMIRKSLGLTMEKFGERLGVKKNSISQIESNNRKLTEQMLLAICNVYNVNENWLRYGKGEIFIESKKTLLTELAKQYALDDMEIAMVEAFIELPPDKRSTIKDYLTALTKKYENRLEEELIQDRIDREVETYRRELELEARMGGK